MKTKEELNALKEEVEAVNRKLHELTDDELEQVIAGCGAGLENSDGSESEIIRKLMEAIKDMKEKAALSAELKGAKATVDPICGWLDQSDQ